MKKKKEPASRMQKEGNDDLSKLHFVANNLIENVRAVKREWKKRG